MRIERNVRKCSGSTSGPEMPHAAEWPHLRSKGTPCIVREPVCSLVEFTLADIYECEEQTRRTKRKYIDGCCLPGGKREFLIEHLWPGDSPSLLRALTHSAHHQTQRGKLMDQTSSVAFNRAALRRSLRIRFQSSIRANPIRLKFRNRHDQ